MADTAEQRAADETQTASDSTRAVDSIGRLVPTTDRHTNTAPQTPDELIDAFTKGFDFFTRDQMLEAIESGMFQIYRLTPDAWALLEFVETRYGKTMNILTVAGSQDQWAPGWDAIEKIAAENECDLIYSIGHPGWKRFMIERGFETEPMLKMLKKVAP